MLAKRLGDAIYLARDENEIACNRRLAIAGRLEVKRRVDTLGGQEFHPVLGDLFRTRHAELQHPVVDTSIASERGFDLLLVDLGASTRNSGRPAASAGAHRSAAPRATV